MISEKLEMLISRYDDGDLSAAERARVEAVLDEQPEARELLEQYRRLGGAMLEGPDVTAGVDFEEFAGSVRRSVAQIPMQRAEERGSILLRRRWVWELAAAAVVMIGAVGWFVLAGKPGAPEKAAGPVVYVAGGQPAQLHRVIKVGLSEPKTAATGVIRQAMVEIGQGQANGTKVARAGAQEMGQVLCCAAGQISGSKKTGTFEDVGFEMFF